MSKKHDYTHESMAVPVIGILFFITSIISLIVMEWTVMQRAIVLFLFLSFYLVLCILGQSMQSAHEDE